MSKNNIRVASSEIAFELFGDLTKYQALLAVQKQGIISAFPDVNLTTHFNALDTRIISLCPMVLCHSLLSDLSLPCPDNLLTGIGLSAFSISTHE